VLLRVLLLLFVVVVVVVVVVVCCCCLSDILSWRNHFSANLDLSDVLSSNSPHKCTAVLVWERHIQRPLPQT
jgi:hypothetical protein